jgi:SAM-dependent methyltransferase
MASTLPSAEPINKYVVFSERLLENLGAPLTENAKVFDLGSGSGNLVNSFRERGYDCLGADLYGEGGVHETQAHLSNIDSVSPYILPYESSTFSFAISQNVFEHVMDYDSTLSELSRVLKPGSVSLHMFPARYIPIEEHVFIPWASIFQSYAYLYCWSWFSKLSPKWRRSERGKLSWTETANRNKEFLEVGLNYLPGEEILVCAKRHFSTAYFGDKYLFGLWPGRISKLETLTRIFPFILKLHSAFRMRVLILRK